MIVAFLLSTLLSGCRHAAPTDDAEPLDSGAPDVVTEVNYTPEIVASGVMDGQTAVVDGFVNPLTGDTYVLDAGGTMLRYLLDTYIYPAGDYCVGGTLDEEGICRGEGVVWTSGRIESPNQTLNMCLDAVHGELYLIKAGGQNVEIVDVDKAGADPYTYQRAERNPKFPLAIAEAVNWTGPCDYDPANDTLLITSGPQLALAQLSVGESLELIKNVPLGFAAGALAVVDTRIVLWDTTGNRVVLLDESTFQEVASWTAPVPILDMAIERGTGNAWVALGDSGLAHVRFDAGDYPIADTVPTAGAATQVVADPDRGLAWALIRGATGDEVALAQGSTVRGSTPIAGTILGFAAPSHTGDLSVFYTPEGGGSTAYTVLAPVEDVQTLEPVHIFLFTTIEEPSDINMAAPCTGSGTTFEAELTLVRNNAAVLATLGVPIAMAITDNFAQKAEECGETGIYQELVDYGFELGAMLHNRPCYNCSTGGSFNPDYCPPTDANYIASTSGAACFPDDPEYCAIGDWDCYYAFLAERVDIADRNIPGGASFIVGGDRHGMWKYDWIRLYREVERPTIGLTGFDTTLFAGTWAYNVIDYDDPRGKNPAPWHIDRRAPAWHLADINAWDQDSPTSELLYLSGNNSATVKVAEQQQSGLYMLDFFDVATQVAYRPDDFEVQYQWLRSAVSNRKPGAINTWYFHIHDTGTLNLRDANNLPVSTDMDGEGGEEPIDAEVMLADFVTRVNTRYDGTGAVKWSYPSEIRALDTTRE